MKAVPDVRHVFRHHAAGVCVITAAGPLRPAGFTATSVTSLSAHPPLLSFNISRTASSWPQVAAATHVGVHLLGAEQTETAAVFARSGIDRFAAIGWAPGPHGVPVLEDCVTWAVAGVRHRFEAGDHVLVVAEMVHVSDQAPLPGAEPEREPLVYHQGRFRRLAGSGGATR